MDYQSGVRKNRKWPKNAKLLKNNLKTKAAAKKNATFLFFMCLTQFQ